MSNYHAYLIRFWREDNHQSWRVALVLPQTGEKRIFASVEQAFAFLMEQLVQQNDEEVLDVAGETWDLQRETQCTSTVE